MPDRCRPTVAPCIYDVQAAGASAVDLWTLPLDGERRPRALFASPAVEFGARISPDGRFVAHVSGSSGRNEVFVRTFPAGSGVWQISNQGGLSRSGLAMVASSTSAIVACSTG